jgi:RimJ/RimL family protein N-acetyltransferase
VSTPSKIRLETPHYILRTIEPDDASDSWGQWLTHSDTARMLNAPVRAAPVKDIRDYIATFDGHNRHLLGIFQKDGDQLVGIRALYVDWGRRSFVVNVLVGEVAARGKGAREETGEVMYRYFFEVLGMQAAVCTVLAHNAPILKVMSDNGWKLTDTTYKAATAGGAPVEVRSYRLSRETWARKAVEKAARTQG